jgi:hypothetical protein
VAPLERARGALAEGFRFAIALAKDIRKLLTLTLLNIVPIVNLSVTGYFAKVVRDNPRQPPEVRGFKELLKEGFRLLLVQLLLGFIIVGLPSWAATFVLLALRVNAYELFKTVYENVPAALFWISSMFISVFVGNLLIAPAIGFYAKRGVLTLEDAWRAVRDFGLTEYVFVCLVLAALHSPLAAAAQFSLTSSVQQPPMQRYAVGAAEALPVIVGLLVQRIIHSQLPFVVSTPLVVLINSIHFKVLAQLPYPAAAPPPPPPPPTPPPTIEEMYERLVDRVLRTWGGTPERARARIESTIRKVMEERGVSRDEAVRMLYEEL